MQFKINDFGIVVGNTKISPNSCMITILSQSNGKWRGFYSLKKPSVLLGSLCKFCLTTKALEDPGQFAIEIATTSDMTSIWHNPLLTSAFAVICECAARFIPEGIKNIYTFRLLKDTLTQMNEQNLYGIIMKWENHITQEYLDLKLPTFPVTKEGFLAHVRRSRCLNNRIREDFMSILGLYV